MDMEKALHGKASLESTLFTIFEKRRGFMIVVGATSAFCASGCFIFYLRRWQLCARNPEEECQEPSLKSVFGGSLACSVENSTPEVPICTSEALPTSEEPSRHVDPELLACGQRLSFVYSKGTRAGTRRTVQFRRMVDAKVLEAYDESVEKLRRYAIAYTSQVVYLDSATMDRTEAEAVHPPFAPCCASCAKEVADAHKNAFSLKYGDRGAEKITAELERRAQAEAEQLVAADGSICRERLSILQNSFGIEFVQRVFKRVAFDTLHRFSKADTKAVHALALNESLLNDDFREMDLWQRVPTSLRSLFPERMHSVFPDLEELLKHYSDMVPDSLKASQPLLPAHVDANRVTWPAQDASRRRVGINEFRSLLRSFSCGILEDVALNANSLILGGSTLPRCLCSLTCRQQTMCQTEAQATYVESKLTAALVKKIQQVDRKHDTACSVNVRRYLAKKIAWLATASEGAAQIQQEIRQEFNSPAWEGAAIDLFVVGDQLFEKTRQAITQLYHNILRVTGGVQPIVLRRAAQGVLTMSGGHPLPHVNIFCKAARSSQHLVAHCDIDCSAMAYDGQHLWAAARCFRALTSAFNFIHPEVLRSDAKKGIQSVIRFSKYFHRGFGLLVLEQCKHSPRCDATLPHADLDRVRSICLPGEFPHLHGLPSEKGRDLATWMRLTDKRMMGASPDAAAQEHYRGFFNSSDLIPWGPGVCPDTLRAFVKHLKRSDMVHEIPSSHYLVGNVRNTTFSADNYISLAIEKEKSLGARKYWTIQEKTSTACYMCKVPIDTLEKVPVCVECSMFNRQKCAEHVDCTGMVAVVTGARMKIGRACAVRLLRAGATVVATSRFGRVALDGFRQEADYASFQDRLVVEAANFSNLGSVEGLVRKVLARFSRVDILIHNAAQSIRRPPAYYESLIKKEMALQRIGDRTAGNGATEQASQVTPSFVSEAVSLLPLSQPVQFRPVLASDQVAEARKAEWFPSGQVDAHGEQLDLRTETSWTMKLEEIEDKELLEVLCVNLVAPYLLTAQWLPLLRQSPEAFIVFVTSQEGVFSGRRAKQEAHPHTNAAKAGLNMLAKTLAGDLRRDRIFVSAVDPGWVSWMSPIGKKKPEKPPLSEEDGAARVLDPIFSGLKALEKGLVPPSGVLFKDFRVSPW